MNVSDLAIVGTRAILDKTGDVVSRAKMEVAIHAIFQAIREITPVEKVTISNFGTFTTRKVPHKLVKTQFTTKAPNGVVEVEAHLTPSFKPSVKYKSALRYSDKTIVA